MAQLRIYKPNSIDIPDDSPVRKIVPNFSKFTLRDQKSIDTSTLFYDIFLDPNSNRLIGLGPNLFNLKEDLFPMTISYSGRPLNHEIDQIKGIVFLRSELLDERPLSSFEIKLSFRAFEQTIVIDPSICKEIPSKSANARLTLTTLQKNNPLPWISDWLLWHHRKFGIQRLVLYDNGSGNREELIDRLSSIAPELEIIFVDWKFPFGLIPYKYCQLGSLNHCRLKFPIPQGYGINLDIDEYLMYAGDSLLDYLDVRLRYPAPGAIMLKQCPIPHIGSGEKHGLVRCFDFKYRKIVPGFANDYSTWNKFGRGKYIYSFNNIGFNSIHSANSLKNRMFSKRYSLVSKIAQYLKQATWELTKRLLRYRISKPRIDMIYACEQEAFYFHFKGLNTGWRGGKIKPVPFNSAIHAIEPRLVQLENSIDPSVPSKRSVEGTVGAETRSRDLHLPEKSTFPRGTIEMD